MVKYPRLATLLNTDAYPYIGFIHPEKFCRFAASAVLGVKNLGSNDHVGPCPVDSRGRADLQYMRSKVVIVGEQSHDLDTHLSVVGPVPGFIMQANFVEALLDNRYFKPVPWLDYVMGVVMFATVTLITITLHDTPWIALALITLSIMAAVSLLLVLILFGGLYVNPVGVGILAVLFNGSHVMVSWVLRRSGGLA